METSFFPSRELVDREKLGEPLMASPSTGFLEDDGWHHYVRIAETNSAVVVARRETAAARRYRPAKLTASNNLKTSLSFFFSNSFSRRVKLSFCFFWFLMSSV